MTHFSISSDSIDSRARFSSWLIFCSKWSFFWFQFWENSNFPENFLSKIFENLRLMTSFLDFFPIFKITDTEFKTLLLVWFWKLIIVFTFLFLIGQLDVREQRHPASEKMKIASWVIRFWLARLMARCCTKFLEKWSILIGRAKISHRKCFPKSLAPTKATAFRERKNHPKNKC